MSILLNDWEYVAQNTLPSDAYNFIAGGVGNEIALACKRHYVSCLKKVNRVLHNSETAQTTSKRLASSTNRRLASTSFIITPTVYHKIIYPHGGLATSKATSTYQTLFIQAFFVRMHSIQNGISGYSMTDLDMDKCLFGTNQIKIRRV